MAADPTLTTPTTPAGTTTTATGTATGTTDQTGAVVPEGFCAEEVRISNHTCNSLHPAIALDCQGNQNIVWYDNRDGNFEIYYKGLPTRLSDAEITEKFSTTDPNSGRLTNVNCPVGFSGFRLLSDVCKEYSSAAEVGGIRRVATSISVNSSALAIYLTDNAADFLAMGISAGAAITFETGLNMNLGTNVKAVVSAKVLEVTYAPAIKADTDFVYYLDNRITKKESCESRITCTTTPSLFPDIASDCYCRSHLVWHDNQTGTDQLFYSQVGYGAFQQKCGPGEVGLNAINLGGGGYSPLANYRPSAYWFVFKGNTSLSNYYAKTGDVGQRITYGVSGDPPSSGRGLHTMFKDSGAYNGLWVGLSKYYDREEWNTEIVDYGSFIPPIEVTSANPVSEVGDFGTTHTFKDLAFMGMTPPDLGIEMETLTLPIIPRCAPGGTVQQLSQQVNEDDIVAAPKRPLPPSFIDPVDITALMTSPYASLDSTLPNRYTIEGDPSGTVYTNSFVSDARNQLSQLVFAKKDAGDQYKFILSTRKCGDGPCAVRPSKTFDSSAEHRSLFSIVLQVWRGPDYRVDSGFIDSQENPAEKVYEKEFFLAPGQDMTTFAFSPGELILNRGSMYYFVAIPSEGLDIMTRGRADGNVIWSSDRTGVFTQYNIPFTLPAYKGINAPIFFDGYLVESPRTDTELDEAAMRDEIPPGTKVECQNSINVDPGLGTQLMIPFTGLHNTAQGLGFNSAMGVLVSSTNYPNGIPYSLESIDANAQRSPYAAPPVGTTNPIPINPTPTPTPTPTPGPTPGPDQPTPWITFQNFIAAGNAIVNTVNGTTDNSGITGFSGAKGETNVCVIETTAGGFSEGEAYCGTGRSGEISKISADSKMVTYTWATVSDSPSVGAGSLNICHDETGIFGNALIVVSLTGNVFVVSSNGSSRLLTKIPPPSSYNGVNWPANFPSDEWLKGVIVMPNDPRRFGPWAGKIVVGGKRSGQVFTVTPTGAVEAFNVCITVEDLKIIKKDKDLFTVSVNDNTLYRTRSSEFEHIVGDLVVSQQDVVSLSQTQTAVRYGCRGRYVRYVTNTSVARVIRGQLWHLHWSAKRQKFIAVMMANMPSSGLDNMSFANLGCVDPPCNGQEDVIPPCEGEAKISNPIRLTSSPGDNQYAALAVTPKQNLWAVWHSTRSGSEDIYAARYFGRCSIWNSSATGGSDLRVTHFSEDGFQRRARFPRVASDLLGNAHIVFQLTDQNGNVDVYYTKSTGQDQFLSPIKITDGPGDSMMPDITIAYDSAKRMMITVVWHDNRFGNWEIMSANSVGGAWTSSAFGGQDTRVTSSKADSMFPRVRSDKDGNLRLVFHSNRSGKYDIYMSSYSALAQKWSSSASGGGDLKISNGPANSMFPDLDTDSTGGLAVTWQDERHQSENPDMHEEVYATYCAKMGHPGRPHFAALVTNIEQKMDFRWEFVDCKTGKPIDSTNNENVCLKVKATNATFWRGVNASGQYSEWAPFKPSIDLDTTVVPWSLSCGNGAKEVCVQVQDQDVVAFPICHSIVLAKPPEAYKVELFVDEAMTIPLPTCGGYQAASKGNIYVKITAPRKILTLPVFDVIQRGLASVYNQETEPITVSNDGTFTVIDPKVVTSKVEDGSLVVEGYQTFRGMFTVKRQDELYHMDGLSRIIIRSNALCAERPGVTSSTSAQEIEVDNIIVPPLTDHNAGWSAAGGTATWTSQSSSIPVSCADLALSFAPTVNDIPFNLTLGGLAQPFTSNSFAGGSATFYVRIAKRSLPSWLSSFALRTLKVSLIKDFLLPSQSTIGSVVVLASELSEVNLDVISGSLEDPEIAGDIDPISITIDALPVIAAGTSLALEIKDESYAGKVNEYGANAKMFVVAVGDTVPPGALPYYIEEF